MNTKRTLLLVGASSYIAPLMTATARAQTSTKASTKISTQANGAAAARPVGTPTQMSDAIKAFTNESKVNTGRVTLELSKLVENGNSVPISVVVDSPMSASDYVQEIMLFAEKNPQSEVARFNLSPQNGTARVSTRMRLSTSQTVTAIAKMNNQQCWQASIDVIVTLAACLDPDE